MPKYIYLRNSEQRLLDHHSISMRKGKIISNRLVKSKTFKQEKKLIRLKHLRKFRMLIGILNKGVRISRGVGLAYERFPILYKGLSNSDPFQ